MDLFLRTDWRAPLFFRQVSRSGPVGSNFVVCFRSKRDTYAHAITGSLVSGTDPSASSFTGPPSDGRAGTGTASPAVPVIYAEQGGRAGTPPPTSDKDISGGHPVHINGTAIAAKMVSVADWVNAYGECDESMQFAWVWMNPTTAEGIATATSVATATVVTEAVPRWLCDDYPFAGRWCHAS